MSDSENEVDPIRNGEMFENYFATKKNCEKKKGKKDSEAKSAKEWTDDETFVQYKGSKNDILDIFRFKINNSEKNSPSISQNSEQIFRYPTRSTMSIIIYSPLSG